MHYSFNFIKTKDEFYLISDFPREAQYHGSIKEFLEETQQIFLLDKSDRFQKDIIKAFKMDTEDILGCGHYETMEKDSNEMEYIKFHYKLDGNHIYTIID